MIATTRLFLDSTRLRVVKEGDAAAAFLLANIGDDVPAKYAAQVAAIAETLPPVKKSKKKAA